MLIGVDAGTTSIRSVLFDDDGRELAVHRRANPSESSGVCHEQDIDLVVSLAHETIAEAAARADELGGRVEAIGITGQGEGLWLLDDSLRPLRKAILWNDGRAEAQARTWQDDAAIYRDIKHTVGSYVRPGSTLTLLRWLLDTEPDTATRTRWVMTCKDVIRTSLVGEAAWERSDASCSLMDLTRNRYATDLLDRLGMAEAARWLPPLVSGGDAVGTVIPGVAARLGLREDTPVSGGLIDIVATAAGAGASATGDACVILGTTGMTFSVVDSYRADDAFNGWEYHADGEHLIMGMGAMAATPNLDLVLRWMGAGTDALASAEEELAQLTERPWETGLLWLPHVATAGERAPFRDSTACGAIHGLKESTTPVHLLHAVMTGVALSVRACLEAASDGRGPIRLTGGGARSTAWCRLVADVTGRRVVVPVGTELAARGAAITAMKARGLDLPPAEEARAIDPDLARKAFHDELFAQYLAAQESARPYWKFRTEAQEMHR